MTQNNDYELFLFYYAYQTFTKTADDLIAEYDMSRQHHRFLFLLTNCQALRLKNYWRI